MALLRNAVSTVVLGSVIVLASGCGGDSDSRVVVPVADYTAFVKARIATTSDDTDPVQINGTRFIDFDRNNPAAYDDVLSP